MATVRLTPNLKVDIFENIRKAYNQRAEVIITTITNMDLGTEAYRLAFNEEEILLAQQLNAMSKEQWVVQATNVLVDISYPSTIKEDNTCVKSFSYKFPNPVVVPINKLRNGYSSEIRLELPSHAPSYDTVKSLLQEREAIEEECRQTVSAIGRNILDKCATLKQLLEVWPNAMEFIPEYAKERHELKITANKSAPTEIVISDEVKASLIKTRMLTSGS
jgi:hypothetical protein